MMTSIANGAAPNFASDIKQLEASYRAHAAQQSKVRMGYGRNVVIVIAIVLAIGFLFLPGECEETKLPIFFIVPNHQKLVASYVLGLLTMAIVAQH